MRIHMKRAQAAMEFLMTYGWAILVVLAAVGALAFFGILSPDKFLPERCTGFAGMDCLEKASIDASANTIAFASKNNLGIDINITGLSDGDTSETSDCDTISSATVSVEGATANDIEPSGYVRVDNGQNFVVTVTCGGGGFSTGRVTADFSLEYSSLETGLSHKGSYSIRGKA